MSLPQQISSIEEIPQEYLPPVINANRYLCNGQILEWSGDTETVESCITVGGARYPLAELHKLDTEAALKLLDAADGAFNRGLGEWPQAGALERIAATERFVEAMIAVREDVVRLLMWEIGKSRKDSETEFDRTVDYIRDTIDYLTNKYNEDCNSMSESGYFGQVRRTPLGIVMSMGPFNYPLNETFCTLIPAILMGNTCIVKLPRYGSLCCLPLLEAFRDSFPAGVVNVYNGRGRETATPIVKTGKVSSLAFIGSSKVANTLRLEHPKPNRMRCTLGLDAKNPGIILEDANVDLAVNEVLAGSLSFNGQRCTALKIIFVHSSISEEFVTKLAEKVDNLTIGYPWENTNITPLPEHGKVEALNNYVEDAIAHGAKKMNARGGETVDTFYFPSVVYPITSECKLWSEEQFGPVVPVVPFDDISEVIDYVVNSDFGQQASLFGEDPQIIAGLVDILANLVCRVNLNTSCRRGPDVFPFTGRKDSAEGTLDIISALRSFSIRSLVATPEKNLDLIQKIRDTNTSKFLATKKTTDQ
eukprot:TRINITY_DN13010_c0_g1_i1.p1 TRINITY_DN13010_c0_g1~~TRINITY_DN13010_c0_g1_i1.p1  ORF type:complete len:532 (+),score=132.84 TRINITY_DN13010_c0_g1_i1:53-1648(+)